MNQPFPVSASKQPLFEVCLIWSTADRLFSFPYLHTGGGFSHNCKLLSKRTSCSISAPWAESSNIARKEKALRCTHIFLFFTIAWYTLVVSCLFFQCISFDCTMRNIMHPQIRPYPAHGAELLYGRGCHSNSVWKFTWLCLHLHSLAFVLVWSVKNWGACSFLDVNREMRSGNTRERGL